MANYENGNNFQHPQNQQIRKIIYGFLERN